MRRHILRNIMKKRQGNNKIRQAWAHYQYVRIMKKCRNNKKVTSWYKAMFEKIGKCVSRKPRQHIYNKIHGAALCMR